LAEDFTLPDLAGRPVRLSSFRGKTVILNFWATWCGACLVELPDLVELQKRYSGQVVVLGISLDGVPDQHGHLPDADENDAGSGAPSGSQRATSSKASIRDKVMRFSQARGINYPVLLDPSNKVGSRFNGGELPTNILIDSSGRVCRRFVGARPLAAWESMLAEIRR
jgi:thiol-disulfide isomerase/thioredoxin